MVRISLIKLLNDFEYLLAPTSHLSTIYDSNYFVNGKPTLQRIKLHKDITASYLEKTKISSKKSAFFIIGPPGSGKSTFVYSLSGQNKTTVILDTDDIKLTLLWDWAKYYSVPNELEYLNDLTYEKIGIWELAGGLVHKESTYLGRQILNDLINNKSDFILSTVLSDFEHFEKLINKLFNLNYEIDGILLQTSYEECVKRCFDRWNNNRKQIDYIAGKYAGGRFVSKKYINYCFYSETNLISISEKNLNLLNSSKLKSYIEFYKENSYIYFKILPL